MSMKTRHVTIVGGGIVGICTALSLQDRGIHVRLIERDDPGQATYLVMQVLYRLGQ